MVYSDLAQQGDILPPSQLLLIEDSDDLQAILKIGLELDGVFSVIPVHPRIDWMTMAQRQVPDLILLDTCWKESDALTGLEHCKKLRQQIPIVCMVSRDRTFDQSLFKEHGVADIIAKPFDLFALIALISNILGTPFGYKGQQH